MWGMLFKKRTWGITGLAVALLWCHRVVSRALRRTSENDTDVWVRPSSFSTLIPDAGHGADVIVIICWGGARKQNVRSLATWYRQRATVVITMNPSTSPYLTGIELVDAFAQLLLIAEQSARCQGRLILHLFSNHGVMTLAAMVIAAERFRTSTPASLLEFVEKFPRNVTVMVIDSAPYFPLRMRYVPETFHSFFEAIGYHRVMGPVVRKSEPNEILFTLPIFTIPTLCFKLFFRNVKCVLSRAHCTPNDLMDIVQRDPTRFLPKQTRIQFIFSTGDHLIPATSVQRFIERLQSLGVCEVKGSQFECNAPHIGLLRMFQTEYLHTVGACVREN